MDLYEMSVDTLESNLVFQNDGFNIASISPDKRYVTLGKTVGNHDSDIYLHDTQSGETRLITEHEGEIQHRSQAFAADSTTLYYLTNADSDFFYLMKMDVDSGDSEIVEQPDWDVMGAWFSRNGTYLTVAINNDARTEIRVYDTATGDRLELPDLPGGDITGLSVSNSEKLIRINHSGARSPNNLFVYNIETRESTQLTDTLNAEIDAADLVETDVVRYESFDGVEIPAILMRPHLAPGEKAPAIIDVHGGPGGQSRPGYAALYQYLSNHGYVVLRVNNRGSSGYGVSFESMDDQKHGEGDLDDCVWGKKYLQSLDYVDPDRIGILGGSYGGYMVLAAMAFRPEEFAVGVDIFGVANWLRTLENIPPWWTAARDALIEELGDPETQRDYLTRISPLFHAENIVKPMLVLQGANDPRVLQVESDEIVAAVRANGVPVEYIVFDDEGHGFSKKKNRIAGYEAILDFLDLHLKAPISAETDD
jgi:dipeptidyl aminopeptidase/acylaminoacyl peptidase